MSSPESKRNSSQASPRNDKPDNSLPPKTPPRPGDRKPLPFDDEDTGTSGQVVDTSNPKGDNNAGLFI